MGSRRKTTQKRSYCFIFVMYKCINGRVPGIIENTACTYTRNHYPMKAKVSASKASVQGMCKKYESTQTVHKQSNECIKLGVHPVSTLTWLSLSHILYTHTHTQWPCGP